VKELELKYRKPTKYNHLGGGLEETGYRRDAEEGTTLETMKDLPSRTRLAASNVEHGGTIGEFLMND
jgi:hypothetical protein